MPYFKDVAKHVVRSVQALGPFRGEARIANLAKEAGRQVALKENSAKKGLDVYKTVKLDDRLHMGQQSAPPGAIGLDPKHPEFGAYNAKNNRVLYGPTDDPQRYNLFRRLMNWADNKIADERYNQSLQGWMNWLWNEQVRFVTERLDALDNLLTYANYTKGVLRNLNKNKTADAHFDPFEKEFKAELWSYIKREGKELMGGSANKALQNTMEPWKFFDPEEYLNKSWIEFKMAVAAYIAYRLAEWKKRYEQEQVLKRNNVRGVKGFFERGALGAAVKAGLEKKRVLITTGFNVDLDAQDKPLAETDGPLGAVSMAIAHVAAGAETVVIVTDEVNLPVVNACLAKCGQPELAKCVDVRAEDVSHDDPGDQFAADLLLNMQIDLVISIEVPGVNRRGDMLNMYGKSVKPFNTALYKFTTQANEMGITTIGVGDGGNESGVQSKKDVAGLGSKYIAPAKNGDEMTSIVPSDFPIASWNSNLGGYAYHLALLSELGLIDQAVKPEHVEPMISAMFEAGALDGASRGTAPGPKSGVDGFPAERHVQDASELYDQLSNWEGHSRRLIQQSGTRPSVFEHFATWDKLNAIIATPHRWILKRLIKEGADVLYEVLELGGRREGRSNRPHFKIALFDSSHGGLIGAKNVIIKDLMARYPDYDLEFILILDHKNAPYGNYSPERLAELDNYAFHYAQSLGADIIGVVCNTASTVLDRPEAKRGIRIPVIDLVKVTSQGILEEGGDHPALLATPATAKSPAYPKTIESLSSGERTLPEKYLVGAPKLAQFINEAGHRDERRVEEAEQLADEYMAAIPKDATTLWMCCTHYPEMIPFFRKSLDKMGLNHIDIMDPAKYMAAGIASAIDQSAQVKELERIGRRYFGPGKHQREVTMHTSEAYSAVADSAVKVSSDGIDAKDLRFVTNVDFSDNVERLYDVENYDYIPSAAQKGASSSQYVKEEAVDPGKLYLAAIDEVKREIQESTFSHGTSSLAPQPESERDLQNEVTYMDVMGEKSAGLGSFEPAHWNPWNRNAELHKIQSALDDGLSPHDVSAIYDVNLELLMRLQSSGELAAASVSHVKQAQQREGLVAEALRTIADNNAQAERIDRDALSGRIATLRLQMGTESNVVPAARDPGSIDQLRAEYGKLKQLLDDHDAALFSRR